DIKGGAGEMARLQGRDEGLLIDDASAGAVDDAGALLHAGELRGADQVARLVGQWRVDGEEVAARQQLVEARDPLNAQLAGAIRSEEGIETDYLHVEAGAPTRDLPADAA